jgi:hypothetical protein
MLIVFAVGSERKFMTSAADGATLAKIWIGVIFSLSRMQERDVPAPRGQMNQLYRPIWYRGIEGEKIGFRKLFVQ